jgi:two-component system, NarL family, sensor histidine kinase UhpB
MTRRVHRRIAAGVAVATLLIALNVAALTFGWSHPEIAAPAILLDVGGLAVIFWLAWRQSLMFDAVVEGRATEQKLETDRVRATLEDTEARYAGILESAMDAVISIDESQRVVLFNAAAEAMFGCTRSEALGQSLDRFLPERFRRAHHAHVAAFGAAGVTNRRMGHNTVLTALRADGTEFPIEASISKAGAGEHQLYTVILRDITLRKTAEDALRHSQAELRELSAQVLQAREDEKTRIARELHDELGQQLTALKMDLEWARGRLPVEATEVSDKLARMNSTLDRTVTATRRISSDLRPLMLDDLGLAEAAEWLAKDFEQRSGIVCELALEDPDALSSLEDATGTALYRMLQESLTNVARHAKATHVDVALGIVGGDVTLTIEDDGRGITDADRTKTGSFGLKGLRERAHYLGGTVEIGPAKDGGTRVAVQVPALTSAAA